MKRFKSRRSFRGRRRGGRRGRGRGKYSRGYLVARGGLRL